MQREMEERIGAIRSTDRLEEQGGTSEVTRLVTGQGVYLLKSATDHRYRKWLAEEAKALKAYGGRPGVPLPRYAGYFESADGSHLLMTFEPGITLTAALRNAGTPEEKEKLIRSFGRLLQKLHKLPWEAVEPDHSEPEADSGDWLSGRLERAGDYVGQGVTEGSPDLLVRLERNRPASVRSALIHGDCTTDNVLVSGGEACLWIDAAGMAIGDPRYDETLAIRTFRDPAYLSAFYEGYTRYRVSGTERAYFENLYEFF